MKALSVRQPWAWAILNGKSVENRDWYTTFRGRVLLHASKGCTRAEFGDACAFMHDIGFAVPVPELEDLPRGAIVGAMTIVDCVQRHKSPFFAGRYGFVLENVVALVRPVPCKGALGFFEVPEEVAAEIRRAA